MKQKGPRTEPWVPSSGCWEAGVGEGGDGGVVMQPTNPPQRGELKDQIRDDTEAWWERVKQMKEPKPNSQHPLLTFSIHHLLHNILLALVKREFAREVETFFALYFDWMLMEVCGWEEWGRGEGENKNNGFQWRHRTHAEQQMKWKCIQFIVNHVDDKPGALGCTWMACTMKGEHATDSLHFLNTDVIKTEISDSVKFSWTGFN